MKNRRIITIFFFVILYTPLFSQVQSSEVEGVLDELFQRLWKEQADNRRMEINDSIQLIIEDYITSDTLFCHTFPDLRYLGQITSPDSLVKILTWNILLDGNRGRYYCYIIRKQDDDKSDIYRLSAPFREESLRTDTTFSGEQWYGALYYDIRPVMSGGRRMWMLLGIDYGNLFITRKVIDVMDFDDNGSVIFGKKWFVSGERMSFREVFEYSSEGVMTVRFSSDTSIVFDHLVPFTNEEDDNRQNYGAFYSYDAYILEDELWSLKTNVDIRNEE